MKYRCPFHKGGKESSPAFYVHVATGLAFCHACAKGWALPQVLKKLGAHAWQITAASKEIGPYEKKKKKTYAESITSFLPEELTGVLGGQCPNDLLEDGFSKDILREAEVGWDPHHSVPVYMIRDHLGRLRMVSGRFSDGYFFYGAKQLQPFFFEDTQYERPEKSDFLWNFHTLYPALFKGAGAENIIVVEGFKACLWLVQNGYPNTVALMGSYLSDEQATLLERVATTVIVFLDLDTAGKSGTIRAVERLKSTSRVRVASYPQENQKELLRDSHRPDEWGGKIQPDYLTKEGLDAALNTSKPYWRLR